MSTVSAQGYAGDIGPDQAWSGLAENRQATLIDVRTRPEWAFVGVPALAALDKQPVLLEWQAYPAMAVAADFVPSLSAALETAGVGRDAPLYFLCRSGVRSRAAAIAMTAAGWTQCFNIAGGFEGPADHDGHRGQVDGWKARGLPWQQS